jgi:hypothetical protein
VHPEAAGLVETGGNHAALAGLGADHYRETPPPGRVTLLDSRAEGVQVDMHEQAGHGADSPSGLVLEQ